MSQHQAQTNYNRYLASRITGGKRITLDRHFGVRFDDRSKTERGSDAFSGARARERRELYGSAGRVV